MLKNKCRFCGSSLKNIVVDLKHQPSANRLLSAIDMERVKSTDSEGKSSLTTYLCDDCFLVQLGEAIRPESIFTEDYVYYSSYNKEWVRHAGLFVDQVIPKFGLTEASRVLEVGSNDGYLLQHFVAKGIPCRGVDPAAKAAEVARERNVETFVGFFGDEMANRIIVDYGYCDLIVGNNVFAHVPAIQEFVASLKNCLAPSGFISLEFPHLANLVENNLFDTIYDEHYFYFSLLAVQRIFSEFGLKVMEVQEVTTHGGSLRVFATHVENNAVLIDASVGKVLARESTMNLNSAAGYENLQLKTDQVRTEALAFLNKEKSAGQKIAAFGAAAKGNTFLNYCDIGVDMIDYVVDDTPAKQGKFLPGSYIPVVSEEKIRETKPDIIVILPWNFREEICRKLDYVHEWGGRLVSFIPDIEVS